MTDFSKLSDEELLAQLSDDDIRILLNEEEKAPQKASTMLGPLGVGEAIANPKLSVQKTLEKNVDAGAQQGLGVFEGATGGLVRGAAEKISGQDLSNFRGDTGAQLAGFLAGPGKLASVVGKDVAKKAVPEAFKTAGRFLKNKDTVPYGSRVASVLGKMTPDAFKAGAVEGGVAGAIGGALFPQEDAFSVEKRALATLAGSVIGAPIGAAVSGFGGFMKARQLAKSAKKVGEKMDRINNRQSYERPTAGEIFPTKDPKKYQEIESVRLEQQNNAMKNLMAQETDEVQKAAKEILPKWENANYRNWANEIDGITSDMAKSGKKIKLTELSDELNTYLKSRKLLGEDGVYSKALSSPSDRAIVKYAKELAESRKNLGQEADAVIGLDDVMNKIRLIRKGVPQRVLSGKAPMTPEHANAREMDKILMNLLDDGSSERMLALKEKYAKFAELRDFARGKFDIKSEYLSDDAQTLLQNFSEKGNKSVVDLTLDRGSIAKLETIEKEVGIPFLSKLRKYGMDFEALEKNTQLLAEKAARTGVMTDIIAKRSQEAIRGIADKLKVPETLTRQLATAAYAYLLSRYLSAVIKRND